MRGPEVNCNCYGSLRTGFNRSTPGYFRDSNPRTYEMLSLQDRVHTLEVHLAQCATFSASILIGVPRHVAQIAHCATFRPSILIRLPCDVAQLANCATFSASILIDVPHHVAQLAHSATFSDSILIGVPCDVA